ncbi:hypothetical protein ONZ45_g7682 [Pleurotus djamor]|nr:hypothetical protein ONZ45_g7682 [Pleurotus djamor]
MHAIAIVVRLVLFTAFACMTIIMGFLYVDKKKHGANFSVFLGFLPAIAVIVFGSQLDIFYTWFFCLPKPIADECRYKNLATRPLHLRAGSSTSTLDSPTIRPSKEPKNYHHADSQGKKMGGADEEMAFDSRWGSSVMMLGADISDNRIRGGSDDVSPSKRSFIVAAVNSLGIPPPPHDRPRRHRGWVDASDGGGSYDRLPSTDSNDTFYKPPSRHKTV